MKVDPTLPAVDSHLLNAVLALVKPPSATTAQTAVKQETSMKVEVGSQAQGDSMVQGEGGEDLAQSEIIGFVVM